jgi:putative transposase
LTVWHPAFLELADSLDACAEKYRRFCAQYTPRKKTGGRRSLWGSRMLDGLGQSGKGKDWQTKTKTVHQNNSSRCGQNRNGN